MYYLKGGDHLHDFSPYGNHGTINGAVWKDGRYGWALDFDGVDDYVGIPDDASLGIETGSWGFWVNADSWQHDTGRAYWLDGRDHNYWIISNDATDLETAIGIGGTWYYVENVDAPATGEWHHIMATYDGSNLRLYIDGREVPESPTAVSRTIDVSSGPARIGDYIGGGYNADGTIDEVRIYDRALSTSEIQAIYNRTKGIFGL